MRWQWVKALLRGRITYIGHRAPVLGHGWSVFCGFYCAVVGPFKIIGKAP